MKYEKGKKECKRKLLLGQKIEEKNKEQKKINPHIFITVCFL